MNIGDTKISKIQIFLMLLLLLGITIGVFLVQRQQILKSRAQQAQDAFVITNPEGSPLPCSGTTCETQSLDVQIKVKDLNSLISE